MERVRHRLKEVISYAWNPTAKTMEKTSVAAYLYDKRGRLRAEWNPSINPALKTRYGYDSEGHVTAITPPGQQPWLLHYGATAVDSTPGRLLSLSRLGAKAPLWNGETLENTALPTLSTKTPVVGTTMSATTGKWSSESVVYGYQWEDCNSSGAE